MYWMRLIRNLYGVHEFSIIFYWPNPEKIIRKLEIIYVDNTIPRSLLQILYLQRFWIGCHNFNKRVYYEIHEIILRYFISIKFISSYILYVKDSIVFCFSKVFSWRCIENHFMLLQFFDNAHRMKHEFIEWSIFNFRVLKRCVRDDSWIRDMT